ncbi:MAG: TlpA disulfide reductase family protein [Chitinophagaceae bacterium]
MCLKDFISSRIDKQISFCLLMSLCFITFLAQGQDELYPRLNIGSAAPPLRIREWLKGKPIQKFEKGKIYVIEFWATWCAPCKAAMPRLSKLAKKYKNKVTFIGIDVYEKNTMSANKIKEFVDSMGQRMYYRVATQDSNLMEISWLNASGETGVPTAFIVNSEARLAWMGHPSHLHEILPKIVKNDWDVNEELLKRNSDKYLEKLDDSLGIEFNKFYRHNAGTTYYLSDSALIAIADIIKTEPKLKYAPVIAYHTFTALLINDPTKAYEYGKVAIAAPTYDYPPYHQIIEVINRYSDDLTLPPKIYELGAEAYQAEIDHIAYPEIVDIPKLYNKMAAWYWRARNKSKAIDAEKKVIKTMKKSNG